MRASREPVTVESRGAGRIRRKLASRLVALGPVALALTCVSTFLRESYEPFVVLQMLMLGSALLSPMAGLTVRAIDASRAKRRARVTVADDVLRIESLVSGDTTSVPIAEIESGWYVPTTGIVEIVLRSGDRIRAAMTQDEADAVLRAARADVTQRTHVVPLRGVIGTPVRGLLGGMLAAIPAAFVAQVVGSMVDGFEQVSFPVWLATWVTLVALGVFATVKWFGSPRLVVGADGIRTQHVFSKRFVPYTDIVDVTRTHGYGEQAGYHYVRVALRNGKPLVLPVIGQNAEQIDGLVARIEAGRRAALRHDPEAALDALARNGRPMDAWRRDLEALLRGGEGYRRVQITRDELLAVLENAGARAEHRLTAAVALSVLGGAEDIERIRVAAGATANDRVRVALDGVANGEYDDGSIASAVEAERAGRS